MEDTKQTRVLRYLQMRISRNRPEDCGTRRMRNKDGHHHLGAGSGVAEQSIYWTCSARTARPHRVHRTPLVRGQPIGPHATTWWQADQHRRARLDGTAVSTPYRDHKATSGASVYGHNSKAAWTAC